MHLRGKSFRFEAVYTDGRREILLDVPRYEFEWQNVYVLSKPKLMPEGTVLSAWRGTTTRPATSRTRSPRRRSPGASRPDEMFVGYVEVALADQDLALGGRRPASATTAAMT